MPGKNLPNKRNSGQASMSVAVQQLVVSSPFPPPDVLTKYNGVDPTFANRLIAVIEEQTRHRIDVENKIISAQLEETKRGQIFAFVLALCALASGCYCFKCGYVKAGFTIITTTSLSLCAVFYAGRIRNAKRNEMRTVRNEPNKT